MKTKIVKIQLLLDHDVTPELLRSWIIDWVHFEDLLFTHEIDFVIRYITEYYGEEYVDMIPDLNVFMDMLEEVKAVVHDLMRKEVPIYVNHLFLDMVHVTIPVSE